MFFTSPMRYVQLVILEKDFQQIIDLLGNFGWIEIKNNENDKNEKIIDREALLEKIEKIIGEVTSFFEIKKTESFGKLIDINSIQEYFTQLLEKIKPYKEKLSILIDKKHEIEKSLNELEKFKVLTITKQEIDSLEFINLKFVSMSTTDLQKLKESMRERLEIIELAKDTYILVTSKKGRWTLDSELKKIHFKELDIPDKGNYLPPKIYSKLKEDLSKTEKEIETIQNSKKNILKKEFNNIKNMIESFNLQQVYLEVFKKINHSGTTTTIEGWILKEKVKPMTEAVKNLLGQKVAIIVYKPEEIEDVKNQKIKVPVVLKNFGIFKSFEKIVLNYGAPEYGSIDPTFFVALSFLTLFGLMFGDMGQGFIIFLIGVIISFLKPFKKFKDLGQILIPIGISSIIFGFLYGAAFCFEHEEIPFLAPINKALFNIDKPYFIYLSFKDINSITNLFLLTITFGIVLNLIGMLINFTNNILKKDYINAIFSKTGLCGFFFLLSLAVIIFELFILKAKVSIIAETSLLISLILILIKEPIDSFIKDKKFFEHGFGMWILHALIELIEVILMTMSNNLSFIRVGAFAFAHFLLSLTTLKLAEAIGGEIFSPAGIIIVILGNALIIILEGMIVTIQTIRLEYYEFFSKFFIRFGKEFKPFKIYKNKTEEI